MHLIARSHIIPQPGSPANLRMTESLVYSITSYINGMYDQRIWLPELVYSAGEDLSLGGRYVVTEDFQTVNKFYASCASAMSLIKEKLFVEARRTLSSACSSVRQILESGHPDTLRYLIGSYYLFIRDGPGPLEDAATILRDYIGRMATIILPKGHPWRQICELIGSIDQKQLNQVLLMSMELITDIYDIQLGKFHESTAENRVHCFEWRYSNNPKDGENAIRKLIYECPKSTSSFATRLHLIKYLVNNLKDQGRFEEQQNLANDLVVDARKYGTYFQLAIALQGRAKAECMLGKYDLAYATQREVADMIIRRNEPESIPFTIAHLTRLENWTREWGWTAKADMIKAEIEDLVAHDTAGVEDFLDDI